MMLIGHDRPPSQIIIREHPSTHFNQTHFNPFFTLGQWLCHVSEAKRIAPVEQFVVGDLARVVSVENVKPWFVKSPAEIGWNRAIQIGYLTLRHGKSPFYTIFNRYSTPFFIAKNWSQKPDWGGMTNFFSPLVIKRMCLLESPV